MSEPPPAPATPMAPVRLEDCARFLGETGIERIHRVDPLFRATDLVPEVSATWARDASGTWLCRESPGAEAHCATLPTERVGRPALRRGPEGATLVEALWGGDDGATRIAAIDMSGATSAQRWAAYVARENATTVPPPPSRPPPPALGALAGIDVVEHGELMVAGTGSRITACRARPTPHCSPLIDVPLLARDRALDRLSCIADGTFCWLEASWGLDITGGTENGSARIFLGGMRRRNAPCPPP